MTTQDTIHLPVGEFESEARSQTVDGQPMVAVWTDGVALTSDNGKSKMMPGISPCAFKLIDGKRYRVSVEVVEEIAVDISKVTADDIKHAKQQADEASKRHLDVANRFALQECPYSIGETIPNGTIRNDNPVVVEKIYALQLFDSSYSWGMACRELTATGKERKHKSVWKYHHK